MEAGRFSAEEIARKNGFGNRERMRRSFVRAFGQSQAIQRTVNSLGAKRTYEQIARTLEFSLTKLRERRDSNPRTATYSQARPSFSLIRMVAGHSALIGAAEFLVAQA